MSDGSRLEDLRRRVLKDPASILFAQLAEEYRRAGDYRRAVLVCRAGLTVHPRYHSARVTLGRALASLGDLDEAQRELEAVLSAAPEHLAAVKALADVRRQRGEIADAARLPVYPQSSESRRARALRTIARLEQWLVALHGTRAVRRA